MEDALRLLAVFPHPDDESMGLGATLVKYAAEGVETHLLCATRGERGWSGPPDQNPGLEALGRIRAAELRAAAQVLGLRSLTFLDYIDGDVDQADPPTIVAAIAAHVRLIRPQVVVTFGPDGAYGHPDHIALAQFTAGALVCAADASHGDEEAGTPWRVSKLYYMVDDKPRADIIRAQMGAFGMAVDGVMRELVGWDEWAVTTRIAAHDHFETVRQAILCHQSQLGDMGPLLEAPNAAVREIFGRNDFVRVFSLVNGGRAPESDLFAGLRP